MLSIGENIKLSIYGSSHGREIGFILENIEEGHRLDLDELQAFIDRRAPGRNALSTPRKESDILFISEGLEDGKTRGRIRGYFLNENTKSKDYSTFKRYPRPSHIDYVAQEKYGEDIDLAGSGFFSGRLTAPIVAAGGIVNQILAKKGINIYSHYKRIGSIEDRDFDFINLNDGAGLDKAFPLVDEKLKKSMVDEILAAKEDRDSLGGIIQVGIKGIEAGLGGPYFERFQSKLGSYIFSIPGVKGLEFGNGFGAASMRGSENNDDFIMVDGRVRTRTNNSGGLNGGISNGMPIIYNIAVKPTSSIYRQQETVDLKEGKQAKIRIEGRHDPAFIVRTPAVFEAISGLCLYDLLR